jgi:hypothetical protein
VPPQQLRPSCQCAARRTNSRLAVVVNKQPSHALVDEVLQELRIVYRPVVLRPVSEQASHERGGQRQRLSPAAQRSRAAAAAAGALASLRLCLLLAGLVLLRLRPGARWLGCGV